MVSEDKLIKAGIRLTDEWFRKFKKKVEHDLSLCETYEEFIERTKEYKPLSLMTVIFCAPPRVSHFVTPLSSSST